jgi:hypothetical protein
MTEAERRRLAGMSATQRSGYSLYNPGVTPVSTNSTRSNISNSVVTGQGVTPISSELFNQVQNTPVGPNLLQQGASFLKDTYNTYKSNRAANAQEREVAYADAVEDLQAGNYVAAGFPSGPVVDPANTFIRGTYGINEIEVDPVEFEESSFELPEFTPVSDSQLNSAFTNYLKSIGYKPGEDGKFTLDTSLYEEEGGILTRTFDQLKQEFQQEYDRLREDLNIQQQEVQKGFRQSQQQISEQAYLGERQLQQALAGRGLGGSGIAQLGRVQQQIARGEQITSLATEYSEAQQAILTAKTRGSEDLSNKLVQANTALAQGQIDISQRQRIEENAFKEFLGSTRMALQEAINSNNYRAYQSEVNSYNAAVQANRDEFNKKVTLANMELSNLYDDFMGQFESLTVEYERVYNDAPDRRKKEVQAEYEAAKSALRRQYEANRDTITGNYGLTG